MRAMIIIDRIYNEDCLVGMQRIPDGMVDAIITDLPYGVLNEQSEGGQWDSIIPLEPMWKQFKRVSKRNAAIVLFCQGMFTAELMMSNKKMWRYNLIWDKGRVNGFLNSKRMPMRQHEDMAVFYQSLPTYNPQMLKCAPHQRNHGQGSLGKVTNRCYGNFTPTPQEISDEKFPASIIYFPKGHDKKSWLHPTQKPVDLLRYLILTYTNPGGVILDATIGSGTTAVAAIMEHRHFIGFETDETYYRKAVERINELRRNPTLF